MPEETTKTKKLGDELKLRRQLEKEREKDGPMFRLDTFSGQVQLIRQIPMTDARLERPRPITDHDVFAYTCWLQSIGFVKIGKDRMNAAIEYEAHENAYSEAVDMLESLPQWDGTERLDDFLYTICGAEAWVDSDDSDGMATIRRSTYIKAVSRKLFLSMIARILKPGSKVDTMVVLEGPQGTKKSTLLRVICFDRDEWFSDSMPPINTKDGRAHLLGKLIVELSEVDHLKQAGTDAMKVFLSAQDDKFRPPWGRREVVHLRQCIFVGTTNDSYYLKDMTGNRRFWVVRVGEIDVEQARAEMPQLWAEALIAAKAGETWHFDDETEAIAREEQESRTVPDTKAELICDWIDRKFVGDKAGLSEFTATMTNILVEALGIPQERHSLESKAMAEVGRAIAKINQLYPGVATSRRTSIGGRIYTFRRDRRVWRA